MKTISASVDKPIIDGWIGSRDETIGEKIWKQFAFYCENSSLNGCKYLTEPGRPWAERSIWFIVYVVMICGASYVVYDVYAEYRRSPIVTTQDRDPYPLNQISFPALALCTLNRISYKSARQLAETIHSSNVSNDTSDEILESLRYLGNLYDYAYEEVESEHESLHRLLTRFYDGEYDVNEIMRNLTPKCSEVLLGCTYASVEVSCSEIFKFRKTQDGYCCTFNYVRQSDEFIPARGYKSEHESRALRPAGPGMTNSLSILIEPLLSDYFYVIPTGRGWKVIIFNAEDYPDYPSGGVMEQTIAPATETYLILDAVAFSTQDHIISYPVEKRKCIFNSELQNELFTGYTYSDCIVNCRVEDIWKTCNCTPFFFPQRNSRRTCDMTDITCLGQNKSKWWVLFPHNVPDDDTDASEMNGGYFRTNQHREKAANALDCSECYPQCNDVRYFVRSSGANLVSSNYLIGNLSFEVNFREQSIVHVFFAKHGVIRLQQEVMYYWYELLSNIGGICSVFVGFSLISVIEILYFIFMPFFNWPRKIVKSDLSTRLDKQWQRDGTTVRTNPELYWEELRPRTRLKKPPRRNQTNNHRKVSNAIEPLSPIISEII